MTRPILIIEDDPDVTNVVRDTLQHAGFTVRTADCGLRGLTLARESHPDLILLDLGLPDFDGREVLRRIRSTSKVPVIILTAHGDTTRKIELLNAGANDYITKPFHPGELTARVNVQLRDDQLGSIVTLGPLEIHSQARQVFAQGQEVRFTPKEYDLLMLLAQQPGRVFSRSELHSKLWSETHSHTSSSLEVHVASLRAELRQVDGHGMIRTVRGIGYALRGRPVR